VFGMGLETRYTGVKAGLGLRQVEITDRSPWEWYAESCACGEPAGGCRVHPRSRPSQRPLASGPMAIPKKT